MKYGDYTMMLDSGPGGAKFGNSFIHNRNSLTDILRFFSLQANLAYNEKSQIISQKISIINIFINQPI